MSVLQEEIIGTELWWDKIDNEIPIIFWGCGNNAHIVRKELGKKGIYPTVYCDNNKELQNTIFDGIKILSYDEIRNVYDKYVIILTTAIKGAFEVVEQLKLAGEKNPVYHMEKAFKVEDEMLEKDDVLENIQKYQEVFDWLGDELSKKIFVENIKFRMTGDKRILAKFSDGDTFFDEKIIPKRSDYSYMDVGAYTGDTLLRFYAFCQGKYNKLYASEPDKGNFAAMQKLIKYGRLEQVRLFPYGCWDKEDILTFYTIKDENKENFDSPNFYKNMNETVPNRWKIPIDKFVEEKIAVNTVDNLLAGEKCSIIKINALAADFRVLKGCRNTINRYKPIVVGEYGTKKENLTDMMIYLKQLNPDYKLVLREKKIFGDYKTVYYAIDRRNMKKCTD